MSPDRASEPNLTALNAAVRRAAKGSRDLLRSGVPQPVLPLVAYLDERGERAVWNAVAMLAQREPDLYNRFVGERNLFHTILEVAETHNWGGERSLLHDEPVATLDWHTLVESLTDQSHQSWLIAVPLANVEIPAAYVPLANDAALAAAEQAPDWKPSATRANTDPFAMERHLGARIGVGVRWRREDQRLGPLDTRRTAVLALVEDGASTMAFDRALTRARYALAVWCLLRPPESHALWPATADWELRPFLHHHVVFKKMGDRRAREHNRVIDEYAMYELPAEDRVLAAPFLAMEAALDVDGGGSLHARATIAAAACLYTLNRRPTDLHRTDALLHLEAAVEAICDTDDTDLEGGRRWAAITDRLGVWRGLKGYTSRELNEAKRLSRDLRNIAAHGSDQVLLNLGYPRDLARPLKDGRIRSGQELACTSLRRCAGATSRRRARCRASRRTGNRARLGRPVVPQPTAC